MNIRQNKNREMIVFLLIISILLGGCKSLLNDSLTIEESEDAKVQNSIDVIVNYQDSLFQPYSYESEYPDAFYIPAEYSENPEDIRGFELLDFINGDTFIYAYQTMIYQDPDTPSSVVSVSGEYVLNPEGSVEDNRTVSDRMVTVLAAYRYTDPENGYRELCKWVSEKTDSQSFTAEAVGEFAKDAEGGKAVIDLYTIYFNGHAAVYKASDVKDSLQGSMSAANLQALITYDFSEVIRRITDQIVQAEGLSGEKDHYQFDIGDLSFSSGGSYVDVTISLICSRNDSENMEAEEGMDEEQYNVRSYDVRMGFYFIRDIRFTVQNTAYGEQRMEFLSNGTGRNVDMEWDVSANAMLTEKDVIRNIPYAYEKSFLEDDAAAKSFIEDSNTGVFDVCASHHFNISGYVITGDLCMESESAPTVVRKGYYMVSDNRVQADAEAAFIASRSFVLKNPKVLMYQWNRQRLENDWQYSEYFLMNRLLMYYASYVPEGADENNRGFWGIDWSGEIDPMGGNRWINFILRFNSYNYMQPIENFAGSQAIDRIRGCILQGRVYAACYTQDGIYLYLIQKTYIGQKWIYTINLAEVFEYEKLNESAVLLDGQNSRTDTAPETYAPYSIGQWSARMLNQQDDRKIFTLCTPSLGLEIIKDDGTPYIPVFQKNVIYEEETVTQNQTTGYYQQLTRLEDGIAAYAVFENQGEDRESYPFLLLGYDYRNGLFTAMDIVRAKVIPFTVIDPDQNSTDEVWNRLEAGEGEEAVFYLKDCYDRSLYGTVPMVEGYHMD